MKVATRIVFKISNTFSEWAKAFDDDRANQEAAGIKASFIGWSSSRYLNPLNFHTITIEATALKLE